MKSLISASVFIVLSGCALAQPPNTKFTVHVISAETSEPITNAVVRAGFKERADPWGSGIGKSTRVERKVNSDGTIVLSGKTISEERGGTVFAEDYYTHRFSKRYKHNVALNRWEPWNPTFEVKMRPKRNPVPMVHKGAKWTEFPIYGVPISYDLEIGDWVAPKGRGKIADLVFNVTKSESPSRAEYVLTFSNLNDGIMEHQFPADLKSSFKWPYMAPKAGYASELEKYKVYKNPSRPETNLKKTVNYIFRVRTQTDEEGNIISACYGRITGEIELTTTGRYQFGYYFNPVPNERSLEYNGVNLLKK
jgi:hypothetical protein